MPGISPRTFPLHCKSAMKIKTARMANIIFAGAERFLNFCFITLNLLICVLLSMKIFYSIYFDIASEVFHTAMGSKKALSLRTEPYALFCTYKPYYHINSSRPKEYRPHDIYLCLLLETEMISCVNACHYTDDSE